MTEGVSLPVPCPTGDRDVFQTDVFQTGHFLDGHISDGLILDRTYFRHNIKTGHFLDSDHCHFPEKNNLRIIKVNIILTI